MSNIEKYENLVLGSGGAGKFIASSMGDPGVPLNEFAPGLSED